MADNLRRVLLICYYFPPLGGAGINRPLQLYRKLPECGYECDILTVKPVTYRIYEPELVPGDTVGRIYRSGSRDPQRLMYLLGKRSIEARAIDQARVLSSRFFPDPKIGWVKPAVRLGRTIAENRRYEAIISTSPPISSHLVAESIAQEFSLPWIADFRDLWTALPIEQSYDSERMQAKARELRERINKKADALVGVNNAVAAYVGAQHAIANAWHEQLAREWSLPDNEDRFIIGVLGTLNDLYPVEPLFRLVSRMREDSPALYERTYIHHVGADETGSIQSLASRFGLEERVESLGRLDRHATIDKLSDAAMCYVATNPTVGSAFTTGRVFTLLPSGRPLLAYGAPGSELMKLVDSTGNGFAFDDNSEADALEWLTSRARAYLAGETSIVLQPDYARPFSDAALARQFADLLNDVIGVSE